MEFVKLELRSLMHRLQNIQYLSVSERNLDFFLKYHKDIAILHYPL